MKRKIIHILHKVDLLFLNLCAQNKYTAFFYYTFLRAKFKNEMFLSIKGRTKYFENLNRENITSSVLRRNIHRIEKALIMKPRRDVFAQDYIEETLNALRCQVNSEVSDQVEIKWAIDVLTLYFNSIVLTEVLRGQFIIFQDLIDKKMSAFDDQDKYAPIVQNIQDIEEAISFEKFSHLVINRRSTRWFEIKKVSKEIIDRCIEISLEAPSACNRLPYRIVYTVDAQKAQAISNCVGGTGGYAHQIPAIMVIIGDFSCFRDEVDRHLPYIDGSTFGMLFQLACVTVGLSTCVINWPDNSSIDAAIRELIDIEPHERVINLIAIGYPEDGTQVPYSAKKEITTVRKVIR